MRLKITLLLLVLASATFAQTQKVNIKGFGEISATKKADNQYELDLNKYGNFIATGTLDPLAVKIETTIENLREFPGYKLYEKLDLQEIELNIGQNGLTIDASLDTKKNFGDLCKMLKIPNPQMGVSIAVSKTKFKLEGELDFEDDPIIINVVPDFSRFTLENLGVEATAEAGEGNAELSLGFAVQTRWKPTQWDPDIQSVTEFSYNLTTNELSAAASMTDTWSNPMLLSELLKPNSVEFSNVAAALDWPVGAPAPSGFGFTVGKAKFFDLEFGAFLAMTPTDKKIAIQAERNQITMNDFSRILRNGFGLKVPDLFPDNVYIKDVVILYSPTGGEVGEFEVQQGFILKGKANILDAATAQIHYFANLEEGFFMDYRIEADLKEALMKELRKVKPLEPVMDKVLSTFQLRKVHTHLEAGMDLDMSGSTAVAFDVFGKSHSFDMQATLKPKDIIDAIISKVKEQGKVMEIAGKIAGTVGDASQKAYGIASNAFNNARKELGTVARHTHGKEAAKSVGSLITNAVKNGDISWENKSKTKCDEECVPNLARNMARPMLEGNNDAVLSFYRDVYPELTLIEGSSPAETLNLRKDLIWDKWNKLTEKIDEDWKSIIYDKTYIRFYIKPSSATNGGKIYRRLIREQRTEHQKFRKFLFQKMMTDKSTLPSWVFYEASAGSGEFYKMNLDGSLGTKFASTDGWRTTWSEIEYYSANGQNLVLFYDQANGGVAEMYKVKDDGTLGGRIASTSSWLSTWSDIEHYRAGDKDMLLFYQQADGGMGAMYELKANGTLGKRVAMTKGWKGTWSDIEYYSAKGKDFMLFYEQANGGAAEMYSINSNGTLGGRVAATKGWRSTWSDIEYFQMGGKDLMLFYEKKSGTGEVYEITPNGGVGSRVMSFNNWDKSWNDIEPGNLNSIDQQISWLKNNWRSLSAKMSLSSLLFYENTSGTGVLHGVNSNGSLGAQITETDGWRKTWSEVEYYKAGGKDMILFYQQKDGGYAEMYTVGAYGSYGSRVAQTNGWKSTWTDIEYYRAGGKDLMLFYEQAGGGRAEMYRINADGTLGGRIATTSSWLSKWSDIEYYRAGDKDMMLFYQQADGGMGAMFELKENGTLGKRVAMTKGWRATWSDIEYYRANGKDLMLFYEQKTGTAEVYEISPNGGLGGRVMQMKGWRKTWSDIEAY
ncbi:hypothetical protein [Marinilabilia rubra]|uniref:Uncharacterized protein n=1 Tax=Marinilabilia rubra TaxID=2162893 RepID=A0A2U2BBQ0_9BACT|nr:hypothetical protein [Marinilabilia rubra]PWE00488.1 hypothetical protein DDZ16_06045 [Marinilabilia rubra]